jgi:type I restriction enzyme R subunit
LTPRYYQRTAINRAVKEILQGNKRVLLTMATGTGKTLVAFQICWKLWRSEWNQANDPARKSKILYIADREDLVETPKAKRFAPFGEARHKIERGNAVKSREMYFALYQAIADDERREGIYKQYDPDFFDLIVVDECHRGSAHAESTWRNILEYFDGAHQLGMTATPRREANRDTYKYFGNPTYEYSLKQGIEDGFLAPYRTHRVITDADAFNWRPEPGQEDRYGRAIPEGEYGTKDFERKLALKPRTEAIAQHLTDYLKRTNRFAKTIVFCVDQEHALQMKREINNLNTDLTQQYPDYVCRVTSDEGDVGKQHLSDFKDVESKTPVVVTTSKMLTTGVNVPTCKNIVIARVVGTMPEFKQIIGRGTRVREEYGKLSFTILDYTGSATEHFADPAFDGYPEYITEETIEEDGSVDSSTTREVDEEGNIGEEVEGDSMNGDEDEEEEGDDFTPRKYYVDDGHVEVVAETVYRYDRDGNPLDTEHIKDYTGEEVQTLYADSDALREEWADPESRSEIVQKLEDRGIDISELMEEVGHPDADPFDLLCHLAYNKPLRTRRERVKRLRQDKEDFFDKYSGDARGILEELLEKYTTHGPEQLVMPDVLKIPPLKYRGNVSEITERFGGAERFRQAFRQLQSLLYGEVEPASSSEDH